MKKNKFDEDWIEIGIKSFARFYDLRTEDVYVMVKNDNDVFYDMLEEIKESLKDYEDFMVKIRRMPEREKLKRFDLMDL